MSPPSFFAPYSPIGQQQAFHTHMSVRSPPSHPRPDPRGPIARSGSTQLHGPPPFTPPDQATVGPVPHPGAPRPHWPPPFSSPDDGSTPAYTTSAPPPAYSHVPLSGEKSHLRSRDLEESSDDVDVPRVGSRDIIVWILIVMNVGVWGLVFWFWIHDGLAGKLFAEVQAAGNLNFDI
jgi:hypothetical protein